jgi:hypothetical protein
VILQRATVGLIVAALGLPIAMCVIYALARLLESMQDLSGADSLGRVNLGLFVLWAINLVALVIISAINGLMPPPPSSDAAQV